MKKRGRRPLAAQGAAGGGWILQDFIDVVVHVFDEHHRDFYDLEGHWADAPQVRWTRRKTVEA